MTKENIQKKEKKYIKNYENNPVYESQQDQSDEYANESQQAESNKDINNNAQSEDNANLDREIKSENINSGGDEGKRPRFSTKERSKFLKVFVKVKNCLCWTLIVVLCFTLLAILVSRISGQTPSFFGYTIFRVTTGSMEPELMVGDIILDKEVTDVYSLQVGDVVTYKGSGSTEGMLITHKIIKAPYENEHGKIMLQTKGVASDVADDEIQAKRVVGKMVCKIPFINIIYNAFLSPLGFLLLLALLLFVFLDEIICIVRIVMNRNDNKENINEIIQRMQAENASDKNSENGKNIQPEAEKGGKSSTD